MAVGTIHTRAAGAPIDVRGDVETGKVILSIGSTMEVLVELTEVDALTCQILAARKHIRMSRAASPKSPVLKGNRDIEDSSVRVPMPEAVGVGL